MPSRRREIEPQTPDQNLIHRAAAGEEMALAVLYDRCAAMVYSIVNHILKDVPAAEEVLQDIFHRLWRRARDFDPNRGTLAGWLLVMARNRAIGRVRRRRPVEVDALGENLVPLALNLESRSLSRN